MTKPSIPIPVISHPDFVNIPITKTIYKINTFDDGNQQYVDYTHCEPTEPMHLVD